MKTCTKCKELKELKEFNKEKRNKDGFNSHCKSCTKKYREKNKEKLKEKRKEYIKKNKEKINEYIRIKRKKNPLLKLTHNIRVLVIRSIKNKNYTKRSQTYKILGCTYEEFKIHLENQFTDGMTWENQGEWHLDHIYPVSLAKNEEELIKLNHYTNFQPLWAEDNLKKSNKII